MLVKTKQADSLSNRVNPEVHKKLVHQHLCHTLNMDDTQVIDILCALTQPLKNTLESTETAYLSNNNDHFIEAVHSLKGALLNLGLDELALLASKIEQSAKLDEKHEQQIYDQDLLFIRNNLASLLG